MVNYVMLSYPYGKTFPKNVSNTLLNLCHKQANEMPVNVYHNYSICMCVCKPLHSTKPTNWMLGHGHVQYMLGQVYIIYFPVFLACHTVFCILSCIVDMITKQTKQI